MVVLVVVQATGILLLELVLPDKEIMVETRYQAEDMVAAAEVGQLVLVVTHHLRQEVMVGMGQHHL